MSPDTSFISDPISTSTVSRPHGNVLAAQSHPSSVNEYWTFPPKVSSKFKSTSPFRGRKPAT